MREPGQGRTTENEEVKNNAKNVICTTWTNLLQLYRVIGYRAWLRAPHESDPEEGGKNFLSSPRFFFFSGWRQVHKFQCWSKSLLSAITRLLLSLFVPNPSTTIATNSIHSDSLRKKKSGGSKAKWQTFSTFFVLSSIPEKKILQSQAWPCGGSRDAPIMGF